VDVKDNEIGQDQEQKGGLAAVGALLTRERKKQQRNLESVASDLHLRPEVVRAIEGGDEAGLPTTAFVRGYVKSYARLLGLDDVSLLAQLPALDEHRPVPLKRVGMRRRSFSLPIGKWLVWGLLLTGLSLVLIYGVPALERLWSARTSAPVSDQLELPSAGAEQEEGTRLLPLPDVSLPENGQIIAEQAVGPAETQISEPAIDREAEPEEPPEVEEKPSEPAQIQEATPEPASPAVITMRFLEDSWVEMEANGRKLVVGTQRAGSERTVRAEPPIQLLLGNAPAVELIYRGKAVDMTPYRRGKVARITLED
jgi:cytoskeleton protein RodZ